VPFHISHLVRRGYPRRAFVGRTWWAGHPEIHADDRRGDLGVPGTPGTASLCSLASPVDVAQCQQDGGGYRQQHEDLKHVREAGITWAGHREPCSAGAPGPSWAARGVSRVVCDAARADCSRRRRSSPIPLRLSVIRPDVRPATFGFHPPDAFLTPARRIFTRCFHRRSAKPPRSDLVLVMWGTQQPFQDAPLGAGQVNALVVVASHGLAGQVDEIGAASWTGALAATRRNAS
jgi:hypothetical protein